MAWVMVDNHAGTHSFAQVGWERGLISGNKTWFFIEYASSGTTDLPVALSLVNSPGDPSLDNKFSVWFQGSAILYTIDDAGVWNTQNPDWIADEDQYFGETHYPEDQTPGDTNHHLGVHGMSRLYSGSWRDVNSAQQGEHLCIRRRGLGRRSSLPDLGCEVLESSVTGDGS